MMKKKLDTSLALVLVTSDGYSSLVKGFFYFLTSNFSYNFTEIIVVYETKIDQEYDEVHGTKVLYLSSGREKWTNQLELALNNISSTSVALFLEDYFIMEEVNMEVFEFWFTNFLEYNVSHSYYQGQNHSKMESKLLEEYMDEESKYKFIRLKNRINNNCYLITAGGLYNRKFLIDILKPNESPWEFEWFSTVRAFKKNSKIAILSSEKSLLNIPPSGAILKGKLQHCYFENLEDSIIYSLFNNWENVDLKISYKSRLIKRAFLKIKRVIKMIFVYIIS